MFELELGLTHSAGFVGELKDRGEDIDNDGVIDLIHLDFTVNFKKLGRYNISGNLEDSEGKIIVDSLHFDQEKLGPIPMSLVFNVGERDQYAQFKGPFSNGVFDLGWLNIQEVINAEISVDEWRTPYKTKSYIVTK